MKEKISRNTRRPVDWETAFNVSHVLLGMMLFSSSIVLTRRWLTMDLIVEGRGTTACRL
jgi:hypothetical protein